MVANDGRPSWYRGPDDPSGYRVRVAGDLRRMRDRFARLTQEEMAKALSQRLGRPIPDTSISRWESGRKLAGGDVYAAYVDISGAGRPWDRGGQDDRARPDLRVQELEQRIVRLEREAKLALTGGIPPEDLITVKEACELRGIVRQTVHNWMRDGSVRHVSQGRRTLVSRSDILAHPYETHQT